MPVRKSVLIVVSAVAMLAATFAAINVLAQEPAPSPLPPPADSEVFFSGPVIDGPGFCWYRSLGGPRTYAYDSDDDGVAEICSLPASRRETIARQLAMERLARRQFGRFAELFNEECQNVAETYGDPDAEATDDCAGYRAGERRPAGLPPLVPPLAKNPGAFYSGSTIDGRDFCTNFSLGGPRLYGFDSNGDDVADVCSLYNTKRATVARQFALERLAEQQPGLFGQYFDQECQTVAQTYGEPENEATDACVEPRKPKPKPTPVYIPPAVYNRPPSNTNRPQTPQTPQTPQEPEVLEDPSLCPAQSPRPTFDTAPQNLTVTGADAMITLGWDPVPGAKCYDLWFAAEYRDPDKPNQGRKTWKLGATSWIYTVQFPDPDHPSDQKFSIDFTNTVVAATSYDVQVRAAAGNVASPWTEIVTGATTNVIGKPVIDQADPVSNSSIEVSWNHVFGAHIYELQYQVKVGGNWTKAEFCPNHDDYIYIYYQNVLDDGDPIPSNFRTNFEELFGPSYDGPADLESTSTERTLTGLDANTVYQLRVRGVVDDGSCMDSSDDTTGPWSEIVEATTDS